MVNSAGTRGTPEYSFSDRETSCFPCSVGIFKQGLFTAIRGTTGVPESRVEANVLLGGRKQHFVASICGFCIRRSLVLLGQGRVQGAHRGTFVCLLGFVLPLVPAVVLSSCKEGKDAFP